MNAAIAHFGARPRVYPSFFLKAFQKELAYKFEYFVGVFNGLLFMFIFTSLWKAVYTGPAAAQGAPFTKEGIIAYAVYAMLVRISMTQEELGIAGKVRTGEIAMDMIKPVNFMLMTLAESLGGTLFHWFTRVTPIFVVALFAFDAPPPTDPVNWLLLGVSWTFGYLILFYINFGFSLLAFWFMETFSFQLMKFGLFTLFSGGIVPIDFFPEGMKPLIAFLPFPSIIYVPTALFTGHLPPGEGPMLIAIQAAWVVALGLLCRAMWEWGQRKLIVQGG